MRRAAEWLLVLLALAGLLAAGPAAACMPVGAVAAMAVDCPHPSIRSADAHQGAGHTSLPTAKAGAFMPCCITSGASLAAEAAFEPPLRPAAPRLRPVSDSLPTAGTLGPEPPPPRA